MFIVGLVMSIILKKSGSDKHVHISISADDKDALTTNQDSLPEKEVNKVKKPLGQESIKKIPEPDTTDENVSFSDMLQDIIENNIGDKGRLEYIKKRVKDNRTIYNSDVEYVKKQFKKHRNEITKSDD